jgi:hypothetical protein
MRPNFLKSYIVCVLAATMVFFGSGLAAAGGRNRSSPHNNAPHYRGYHYKQPGGYQHHWPSHSYRHHYDYRPRYYYRYYGPPAPYYHYNSYYPGYYYPGGWGGYDGAYYLSGGISEPGFGFVFGTRGNW